MTSHCSQAQPSLKPPLITLISDFGLSDYFVGALKGVLLQRVPSARLVDITHEIPRHDTISGAFVINETYRYFPSGTIHLIIVDPGVGTNRKKIIAKHKGHLFVAPDNGILTYILKNEGCQVYEVHETDFLTFKESATFAGRDHFAPIAASLANGISPDNLGRKCLDSHLINALFYKSEGGHLIGNIVYFDHFGNAISNLCREPLREYLKNPVDFTASVNGKQLKGIRKSYSEGHGKKGNLLINSSGYLEIFALQGSAREMLKLNLMDRIIIN